MYNANLNNNTTHPYSQLLLAIRDFLVPQETGGGAPSEDISANPDANIGLVNSVTTGDIFEIDLDKMTLFPLAHIVVNNVSVNDHHYLFNVSVLFMDIVDIIKNDLHRDSFMGNTNEQDILNEMLYAGTRLSESFRRGTLFKNRIKLQEDSQVLCEPFYEKSENMLAGWSFTFDIEMRNNIKSDLC